jgi:hypothetical protein
MPKKSAPLVFDLKSSVEALSEKRAAVREKALQDICEAARKDSLGDVTLWLETLFSGIVACLKKGAKSEAIEACTTLQAVLITCNDSVADLYEENLYSLGLQLRSHRSDPVRSRIASLIAIGALMCGGGDEALTRIMQRFSGYFGDQSSEVSSSRAAIARLSIESNAPPASPPLHCPAMWEAGPGREVGWRVLHAA